MRKRILSVFLALCMLLGLMPAALAEEPRDVAYDSWQNFQVEQDNGAHYYHGDNIAAFDPNGTGSGYGSGTGVFDVSLVNGQITANETARHKTADILYQPFTISMDVPAYTTYTVTFNTSGSIRRNSDGSSWYYQELFNGVPTGHLNTANSMDESDAGKTVYRNRYSDSSGFTSTYNFTATFSNMTDTLTPVAHEMVYYVGASSSASALSHYHHRIASSLEISAKSCVVSTQSALVESGGNTESYAELADAVDAYEASGGATLTLLKNATGNVTLTKPGEVDLNGHTLTGHITVAENSGEEVIITGGKEVATPGKVVTNSGVHDAILHSGAGTLTLSNLWAEGHYVCYGVRNDNDNGALVLDCSEGTVTVTPELSARKGTLTFKGGWPTIYGKKMETNEPITTGEGGRLWLTTSVEGKNGHGITLNMTTEQLAQNPKLPYQLGCSIGDAPSESNKKTRLEGMDIVTNWPANMDVSRADDYFVHDAALPHFFVVDDTNSSTGKKLIARCHVVTFDLGETGTSYFADSNERTKQAYVYGQDGTNVSEWPVARDFGVEFDHWEDDVGKIWNEGDSITGDLHLYAKWKTVKVNVTFDPNGGTWPGGSKDPKGTEQEYRQPYEWPDRPTRDGYAFDGWSKGYAELSEASIVSTTTDYTVTAKWAKDKAEVTFDNDGATSTRLVEKGGILGNLPTVTPKSGYVFEGWFTAPTGGDKVTSTRKVEDNVTYYAHWSKDVKKCTVTWDANGGSPATQTTQVATTDYYELPSEPTRTGYTFNGWYTDPTEGSKVTELSACREEENHTLYAHWTVKSDIQVSFDVNGGNSTHANKTVTFDSAYGELPVPTNSVTDQIFLGWYTDATNGRLVTASTVVSIGENHTLYAHWGDKHVHPIGTENPTFTELTADNLASNLTDGVLNAGNYYLGDDIVLGDATNGVATKQISVQGTVNLCLNGHKITRDAGTNKYEEYIFRVSGGTLNICDCQGTGEVTLAHSADTSQYYYTPMAYCLNILRGSANLHGGSFTVKGSGSNGSGGNEKDAAVYVGDGTQTGTVLVDGAKLESDKGRGLVIDDKSSAIIKSGSVTGYKNGAVIYGTGATLTVEGGSITGTYSYSDSDSFSYSYSGCAVLVEAGTLVLKGSPTLTSQNNTIRSQIFLKRKGGDTSGSIGVISVEEFLQSVFSVQTDPTPKSGNPQNITTQAGKDYSSHFSVGGRDAGKGYWQPDNYVIRNIGSGDNQVVKIFLKDEAPNPSTPDDPSGGHSHAVCGQKTCSHGEKHDEVPSWTELAAGATSLNAGSYTLGDALPTGGLTIPENQTVNLCLNGKTLTGTITVNGTLNLCDCGTGGTISGTPAIQIKGAGTLNQFGGTLSATTGDQPVTLDPDGTWNFYAGELAAPSGGTGAPKIVPTGTVNLMGEDNAIDMGGGTIEFTGENQTVHIGGKPTTPYNVTQTGGGKISATLPADDTNPTLGEYLKYTGTDGGALALESGEVVLQKIRVISSYDGQELDVGSDGKLTAEQIAVLGTPTEQGKSFEGWYDAVEGGNPITTDTVFNENTTIYPRWRVCNHTNEGGEDAAEGTPTTVGATCTAAGTKTFTCALCKMVVVRTTEALGHDTASDGWTDGGKTHYKVCARNCGEHVDEAEHTWDTGVVSNDKMVYACTVCNAAKEVDLAEYKLTFEVDGYTINPPAGRNQKECTTITLPTAARTGYILEGWVLLDAEGRPSGNVLQGGATTTMPSRDATFQVRWKQDPNYKLNDGDTVVLEDGTTVEKGSDGKVTVTQPGGGKTTAITPGSGDVTINPGTGGGKDKIDIPGGSAVTTTVNGEQGPTITLPDGSGGKVDSSGTVDAPSGTTITTGDGTTITTGTGGGVINSDGNVSFPPSAPGGSDGGGTVSVKKDGVTTGNVPVGGDTEGMNPETGEVPKRVPENNVIQIGDTIVTLPEETITDPTKGGVADDGSIGVPGGSTVQKGEDGAKITVGEEGGETGGTVKEDGSIVLPGGGSISVPNDEGGTTEITAGGNGGTVTAGEDGALTAPAGSTVTNKDEVGNTVGEPTTVGPGGQTVTPGSSSSGGTSLTPGSPIIAGGATITQVGDKVTIEKDGTTTTITLPDSEPVTVIQSTGAVTVPAGSEVKTGENGPVITVGGKGGSVKPGGGIGLPKDGAATIAGGNDSGGTTTTTVTAGSGGNLVPDGNGGITVPGGTTVQTGSGPAITVGEKGGAGGTLDPATGGVTPGNGGKVTIEDDTGKTTTITPPDSGDRKITPDGTGVKVPEDTTVKTGENGLEITIPGSGGSVKPGGTITVPGGGSVSIQNPDGSGTTEIKVPESGSNGAITPNDDGTVTVPGASAVTNQVGGNTVTTTVPGTPDSTGTVTPGSITLEPGMNAEIPGGGEVTNNDDGTVTITGGDGTETTVTLPPNGGGTVTVNPATGEVTVPGGSEVKTGGNGPTITLPADGSGGKVAPDGGVTPNENDGGSGGSVTVDGGGTTTTITPPTGGTVKPGTGAEGEGKVTVPTGTTVQTGGTGPEITVGPGNGGMVDPSDGGVTPENGGKVTVDDGGKTTTITPPGGGKVEPGNHGEVKVPGGTTVQTGDGGPKITVGPGNGGTIDPSDGGVTPENGGKVTVDDGGKTTTITPPGGGKVEPGNHGEVKVPDGTKVQTDGNNPEITVGPGNDGMVGPNDGGVTVPGGGKVTIDDGKGNTAIITPPTGGEVKPDGNGGVTAPGNSEVTKPNGDTGRVPENGGTVKPDGTVGGGGKPEPDNEITLDGGNIVITPPEGTTGTKDDATDTATVPSGSTVQTGGGPVVRVDAENNTVTVTGDGTVEIPASGTVSMDNDTGGGTTNVTVPNGGKVKVEEDGVAVPGGSTVTPPNGNPKITVTDGGTKVKPDGTITVPTGGSVTIPDGKGGETTVTVPGGSVKPNPDGTITIPSGSTVKPDGDPTGTSYDKETTINPDGTPVTGGDTPDNEFTGEKTIGDTTVTVPPGKTGTDNGDDTVSVPSGSTVQTGGGPVVTVETDDTTVKPGGIIVAPDGGGSVSIPGGVDGETEITVPGGKEIKVNEDGVTVPDGGTVKPGNGPEMKLPDGGKVDPNDGGVTPTTDGSVVTGGEGGKPEVTITPPSGSDGNRKVTPSAPDKVDVPAGSTVKPGGDSGPEIKLPQGGTVNPDTGAVTGPEVVVNGTTITGPGETVSTDKDGNTPISGGESDGSIVTNGDITVTVKDGEGVVDKDGTLDFPGGGTVEITKNTAPDNPITTIIKPGGSISVDPEIASKIEGSVTEGGSPVSEATVTLQKGLKKIITMTNQDGKYLFMCIPRDTYNIVATVTKEEKTKTKTELLPITADKVTKDLEMPSDNVNSELKIDASEAVGKNLAADVSKTVVGGLDNEAEQAKEAYPTATSVTITMTVTAKKEENTQDFAEIKKQAKQEAGAAVELEYLEIKVQKTIDNQTTEMNRTESLLEVIIPFVFDDSIEKESVVVYRYHDNMVQLLSGTANVDGEKIEVGDDSVTLYVKHFSTYAISYKKTVENPPDTTVTPPAPSYSGWDDDDDDDDEPTYRPTVETGSHGSVSIRPSDPEEGNRVKITVKPNRGYEVEEVTVTDRDGNPVQVKDNGDGTYTFIQPKGKVSINATFRAVQTAQPAQPTGGYATCSEGEACPIWPFTDASTTAWYHDGVHYCIENGLMNGFSDGTFKPDDTLSRAQLAQILYNLEGRPASGGTSPFTDVPNDAWFANAVIWANQNGIVGGYGNGVFGPNDHITREQLAAMLWRYAQAKGRDVSVGEDTNILSYKDFNQISEYAIPALQWAAGAGVIKGKEGGLLDPTGRATRAQTAVMLQRFLANATH